MLSGQYRVGQVLPWSGREPVLGAAMPPAWYALRVRPNRERAAQAFLARQGVDAWYPVERVWARDRSGRRVERERRLVPGYVLARFARVPVWHRLLGERPGALYLAGVVAWRSSREPAPLHPDRVAELLAVPGLIRSGALRSSSACDVREGDAVRIVAGPLAGLQATAERVHGGVAWLTLGMLGGAPVSCEVVALERVA